MVQNTKHLCHVPGCNVEVPPKLLMCKPHWNLVPPLLKAEVCRCYRPGQEITKTPTAEYLKASRQAINSVVEKIRNAKNQKPGQQLGLELDNPSSEN
ncbi:MAG TPA: hypothetical protein VK203_19675 [Nostocaceae cyanobacterium]|nr:hypothetical protein [Nostocaceae cyanobacterium]